MSHRSDKITPTEPDPKIAGACNRRRGRHRCEVLLGRAFQESLLVRNTSQVSPRKTSLVSPSVLIEVPMSSRGRRKRPRTLLWYSDRSGRTAPSTLTSGDRICLRAGRRRAQGCRSEFRRSRAEAADPTPQVRQSAARKKQYLLSRCGLLSTRSESPNFSFDQSKVRKNLEAKKLFHQALGAPGCHSLCGESSLQVPQCR